MFNRYIVLCLWIMLWCAMLLHCSFVTLKEAETESETRNVEGPRDRVCDGKACEDEIIEGNGDEATDNSETLPPLPHSDVVEDIIQCYEARSNILAKAVDNMTRQDDVDTHYQALKEPVDKLKELLATTKNVYEFLEAKGMERVVVPNLHISNTDLRRGLLQLIKILFKTAPTTTKTMIPVVVLDRILDIFEDDERLEFKSYSLDIMYAWLPEMPKIQTRVMKLKGLDPFVNEMHKLDTNSINVLLKLFSKVLQEHVDSRKDFSMKRGDELAKINTYRRIGLIERIRTAEGCMGVLSFFEATRSYNSDENLLPVLEIIQNIKPYCMERFRGVSKANEFFSGLLRVVQEKSHISNSTQWDKMLQEYLDKINETSKDEL